MREKEYKTLAFSFASQRYEELRPLLERLNELETEQVGGRVGGWVDGWMNEKEYKTLAFSFASQRYEELRPLLERLNELETEQVGGWVGGWVDECSFVPPSGTRSSGRSWRG